MESYNLEVWTSQPVKSSLNPVRYFSCGHFLSVMNTHATVGFDKQAAQLLAHLGVPSFCRVLMVRNLRKQEKTLQFFT